MDVFIRFLIQHGGISFSMPTRIPPGWTILSDGSSSDCLHSHHKNGFSVDLDSNGCLDDTTTSSSGVDSIRQLFDRILSIFLSRTKENRPLPAMFGDGQNVDLCKLYWAVRERGGFECVTENGLWGTVAGVSGFGPDFGSCVKLVYAKYLNSLDRWLQRILKEKGINENNPESLGELSLVELEAETRRIFLEVSDRNEDAGPTDEAPKRIERLGLDMAREHVIIDVDDDDDDDIMILDHNPMKNSSKQNRDGDAAAILSDSVGSDSLKRKWERDSLLEMLNWIRSMARSVEKLTMVDVWEEPRSITCGDNEHWVQALVARDALLLRRHGSPSVVSALFQKKQKTHPSMYEDYSGSRCSDRLHSLDKRSSLTVSCSGISLSPNGDLDNPITPYNVGSAKRALRTFASLSARTVVGLFCKDQIRKRVPVGPLFQAEVPAWTGPTSNTYDDSKWLGTQDWPSLTSPLKMTEKELIGKGRPSSCGCRLRGSVECVRFHVQERRLLLKRDLGSIFYTWKFDRMGEEVSLAWTEDEEKRFKVLVRLNPPSLGNSFWIPVFKSFPFKTRRSLASYYFNVFVLRRRSYQNRVTPKNIDSDDEESEFEFLGNSFGHEAVTVCVSSAILCSQNKQCQSVEELKDVD